MKYITPQSIREISLITIQNILLSTVIGSAWNFFPIILFYYHYRFVYYPSSQFSLTDQFKFCNAKNTHHVNKICTMYILHACLNVPQAGWKGICLVYGFEGKSERKSVVKMINWTSYFFHKRDPSQFNYNLLSSFRLWGQPSSHYS